MPTAVLGGVPTWWAAHGTGEPAVVLRPGGVDFRAGAACRALPEAEPAEGPVPALAPVRRRRGS